MTDALIEEQDAGHLYGFGNPSAKPSRLQQIVEQRVKDVEEAKAVVPLQKLEELVKSFRLEFGQPLKLVEHLSAAEDSPWQLALAAEFKRASPSKGDINVDLDAAAQALEYTKVGARILSVLTEPKWFKGSLEDLKQVRVETQRWKHAHESGSWRPACLRKDFIIDEYQVAEAAAYGADTVLLMVSILRQSRLRSLVACCRSYGLEPIVEVVTLRELKVALDADARVIGVNNRDLHTFELDKNRTAAVAKELKQTFNMSYGKDAALKVLAFSGLSTAEDVAQCRAIGCSGVLVGEALMRASDPGAAILEMMGSQAETVLPVAPGAVIVKVCGVTRPNDATCAISAGANLIGVIFAESKRQASASQASSIVEVVRKFGERVDAVAAPSWAGNSGQEQYVKRCGAFRQACKRTPLVVGVFMDQPIEEVEQSVAATKVDVIQLHGKESVQFLQDLRTRVPDVWVLKVVHLPPRDDAEPIEKLADELRSRLTSYATVCDAVLLDTAVKGSASGGTGAKFDWSLAAKVQDAWGFPVIVAGGLTDANVADLIVQAKPFGVDVASGVEDSPGVKNLQKTDGFVRAAKRARIA